uniref:Defensin n=1 Tax=Rhipicephalus appendiculatus TaxID=34631 RepID=A0A131YF20_RHIAP
MVGKVSLVGVATLSAVMMVLCVTEVHTCEEEECRSRCLEHGARSSECVWGICQCLNYRRPRVGSHLHAWPKHRKYSVDSDV